MQQRRAVTIRLMVYSGRPDPEWEADAAEIDALAERAARAVGGEPSNAPPAGGLGYRGFLIRSGDPRLPRELTVFRGVVTEHDGRAARHWRDNAGLEELLIEQAAAHDQGAVLAALGVTRRGG